MNKILRIDEKLKLLEKPFLHPLYEIELKNIDTLIVCAGFEDRAIEIIKRTVLNMKSTFSVIIIEYLPNMETNRIDTILNICNDNRLPISRYVYDRENPAFSGENIYKLISETTGRIYIDISGMSRLLIVQLIVAIYQKRLSFENISIFYSEAQNYPPYKDEVEKEFKQRESPDELTKTIMFLSSGVFETCIVPELSSLAMQGQPIRLVAFPSFNTQQLVTLRSEIQPQFYTFINGIPVLEENKWRTENIRRLNDIDKISRKEEKNLCTLDYIKTLDYLLEVYDNYNTLQKIIIAPIGSKMQTVAVGIFRSFMNDVQIVYPTPIEFPQSERYTIGVKQVYRLDLDEFSLMS